MLGQLCSIPGCVRPTMRAANRGLAVFHCRYHVQFKARHGSHWCPTYKAGELKPYVAAAFRWIEAKRERREVWLALSRLSGLLANAGKVEPAQNLKRAPTAARAKVAFARLREAGIKPERMLAIHLGMAALIKDDRGSHGTEEFLLVQIAKALHRLASGTHKRWQIDTGRGVFPARFDAFPKSSGLVLRAIGAAMDECCREVVKVALEATIDLKRQKHGLHPSHLPGWKPLWQRQREAAR